MKESDSPTPTFSWRVAFSWPRLRAVALACALVSAIIWPAWVSPYWMLIVRLLAGGLFFLAVFGACEVWPRRLPPRLPRWVFQVAAIALSVPISFALIYTISNWGYDPPWWKHDGKLFGFGLMTGFGLLIAPWIAFGAIVRQREAFAEEQALAFQLERSELQRTALDARLRQLQAQVEPHFLFNTLANVQMLVKHQPIRAQAVLGSLIAYLRAAVPRLHETATTLGAELTLVRAYLDLMQMRMPDRLASQIQTDPDVEALCCPPATLLTLVENAVTHGIDPSESGGHVNIAIGRRADRVRVTVSDSGVGLRAVTQARLGTGLSSLRERLQLFFGPNIRVELHPGNPRGACAELEFPALTARSAS